MHSIRTLLLIAAFLSQSSYADQSVQHLYQQGTTHYTNGDLTTALHYFTNALQQLPDNGTIHHALASTHRKLNNVTQAAFHYEQALRHNPTSGDSSFGLALTLLAQGKDAQGWALFNRWRSPEVLKQCPTHLADVAHKRVVITAEWGLGDMIHYIRYAYHLKKAGAYVIVQTHPALYRLFAGCDFIDERILAPSLPVNVDYIIPLLYLPTLCFAQEKSDPVQVPYLQSLQSLHRQWDDQIDNDTHCNIGICWDIGHHDTNIPAWQRSAPLEYWTSLSTLPGISLYSLQKNGAHELERIRSKLAVTDFGPRFDSDHGAFIDSAALIKRMDLIITVDTAIAHLAGALGVPTWVLLPYSPDYRWQLHGEQTNHYPTMRLFRQTAPGDWKSVIESIIHALRELMR